MNIPDILALDFDGVLCDGMREYFEASRRTYMRVWPDEQAPGEELFPAFRALRPVIMTGWEMPLLLRAIVQARSKSSLLQNWEAVRDELTKSGQLHGEALVSQLAHTLDEVRRDWIATDRHDWLERHAPYCALDDVRHLLDGALQVVPEDLHGERVQAHQLSLRSHRLPNRSTSPT